MRRLVSMLIPLLAVSSATAGVAAASDDMPEPAGTVRDIASTFEVVEITVTVGELGSSSGSEATQRMAAARDGEAFTSSFDVAAHTPSSHREACFYARPTWTRYNGFGKLSSRAWYYIEWCGLDGIVTRVLTLYCGGVAGGGFGYDGCTIRRGSTGYSKLHVSGTWRFPFRIGIYTFVTRTVTVSARHYADGRYSGTWWMYQ